MSDMLMEDDIKMGEDVYEAGDNKEVEELAWKRQIEAIDQLTGRPVVDMETAGPEARERLRAYNMAMLMDEIDRILRTTSSEVGESASQLRFSDPQ